MRCHRAFIVNMSYIQDIQENDLLMKDGSRVPLRKNGRKEIRRQVSDFFTERLYEVG